MTIGVSGLWKLYSSNPRGFFLGDPWLICILCRAVRFSDDTHGCWHFIKFNAGVVLENWWL